MRWVQASCLLLAWAIILTQARSIAKTKREIEIPYKNVTSVEMEIEMLDKEIPTTTKEITTIDPDIVVSTESESEMVMVTEDTQQVENFRPETTLSEIKNTDQESKLTIPFVSTTPESIPIIINATTTPRSFDQGRAMQNFMDSSGVTTTERTLSVTPMKLQPLTLTTSTTTVRSTAMPAQAASHENAIDEESKTTTAVQGHQMPEKRAKFISENSTNAQQLSPEVWGLAAMMKSVPKISTTSTTTETILPNDIEQQEISRMKNVSEQYNEKNLLDWQHIERIMQENRTEFIVSTTLDATEAATQAIEETTESLSDLKLLENGVDEEADVAKPNLTDTGTVTAKPSTNTSHSAEPLLQELVTKLTEMSATTISNDLAKESELTVKTTTTTESTTEALKPETNLNLIESESVSENSTAKTDLKMEPVVQTLTTTKTTSPTESTTMATSNNFNFKLSEKTDLVSESTTSTESAAFNDLDVMPVRNNESIEKATTTTESAALNDLEFIVPKNPGSTSKASNTTESKTLEPQSKLNLTEIETTSAKSDFTKELVVQRLETTDLQDHVETTTAAATVYLNHLNLASSTAATETTNDLKLTISNATTQTSNDLYLTAAKMLDLTETTATTTTTTATTTTTTETPAVTDYTVNISTHTHMPHTTTKTTTTEMAMKTTQAEAYDVTTSASVSTNKDNQVSPQATAELSTITVAATSPSTPKEIVQISNEVEITTVKNLKEADKIPTTTARTTSETAEETNNNDIKVTEASTATTTKTTSIATTTEIIDNRVQNLTEAAYIAPAGENNIPNSIAGATNLSTTERNNVENTTATTTKTTKVVTEHYDEDIADDDDVNLNDDDELKRQQVDEEHVLDGKTPMATTNAPPIISLLDDSTSRSTTTSTTPLPNTTTKMLPEITTTSTMAPVPSSATVPAVIVANNVPNPTLMPTISNELEMDAIQSSHPQPNSQGTDVNVIIAITVSVIGVVALILLVAFLYLMRKRQKQMSYGQRCRPVSLDAYSLDNVSVLGSVRRGKNGRDLRASKRTYGNAAFDDPSLRHNLLSAHELGKFVTQRSTIFEEFRDVPQIIARADEVPTGCEDKNRYANVIPLPETRVVLQRQNDDDKTEYINANYVRGPRDAPNYYIACQAPLESTTADFWRMIWEQQSRVIIQATDLTENGIERCAEYLPPSTLDNHSSYGDYQVTIKNREVKDKYAISTLMLKHVEGEECRELTHYWYTWPETGVPLDEAPIIAMLLEARSSLKTYCLEDQQQEQKQKDKDESEAGGSNEINGNNVNAGKASGRQQQGPLTIHCSPGTGRTGTIIASDMAIRSLETPKRSVDIPQLVYYVRRGRASAVQTKEQYEFIYKVANVYATKITNLSNDN